MPRELETSPNRKLFSQILVLKLLYPDKKEWLNKVLIELKAIVEEYENDISLRHIGFPEDWYEQLEK
jgi:abortive infection bacteriophage resistance protein